MKQALILIISAIILTACGSSGTKNASNEEGIITVSILPQKTFVEKIAGDDFKVNVLIPPGTSPAAYTLLPSQLKDIARSSIWFRIGYIGFEHSWKDKIIQANSKMRVVDLSNGLDLIAESVEQHGDHVHYGGVDPHIWLSPKLVKNMAEVILNELTVLKPEKSKEYKLNYLKFVKEIDDLDREIRGMLSEHRGKKIIVFHPSLTYYARDYELDQYALETGGKEPTAQQMARVVDLAKEGDIDVIYIQSEFDREHARVFAEEINGKIIQVRPLDPNWIDNLKEMTTIFAENF